MERVLGVRHDQRGPREIEEQELSVRSPPDVGETAPYVPVFVSGGIELGRQARERTMYLTPIGRRRRGQEWLAPRRLERVPILGCQSASREPVQPPGPRRVTPSGLDRRCPWRHFVNPDMTAKDWIDPDEQSSCAGLTDR